MSDSKKQSRRGTAIGLTLDQIVDAALELLEEQGLSGLSARAVAGRVGCEAMSLYHHVGNMDGLLDAVVDRLLGSLPHRGTGLAAVATGAHAYLALADRYPVAFQLVATRRWHTPRAIAMVGAMIGDLQAAGLAPEASMRQARILGAYLNGAGLALAAWSRDHRAAVEIGPASARGAAAVRADLLAGLDRILAGTACA